MLLRLEISYLYFVQEMRSLQTHSDVGTIPILLTVTSIERHEWLGDCAFTRAVDALFTGGKRGICSLNFIQVDPLK